MFTCSSSQVIIASYTLSELLENMKLMRMKYGINITDVEILVETVISTSVTYNPILHEWQLHICLCYTSS